MGLANSPGFFQHRIEDLFAGYLWKFVLIYIDNIIVFNRNQKEHLEHLDCALELLECSGVTIAVSKCYFGFPSVQALGHYVSRLRLSTLQSKTKAMQQILFPSNLRELKSVIRLFDYYRKYVEHYASLVDPLVRIKTKGFKEAAKEGCQRQDHAEKTQVQQICKTEEELQKCKEAFELIRHKLCTAPILGHPDFDKPFILYVDRSKQRGYGAALHQLDNEGIERVMLYLSKCLLTAERRYESTGISPYEMLYGVVPQTIFDQTILDNSTARNFARKQEAIRSEAADALVMAQAKMSHYFAETHIPFKPGDKVWIKVAKKLSVGYKIPDQSVLDPIKVGPYKILERIGSLAYRVELPGNMKIHPVISIVHLEPYEKDDYDQETAPRIPLEGLELAHLNAVVPTERVEGITIETKPREYVVERLLGYEIRKPKGGTEAIPMIKVRWQGYRDSERDTWEPEKEIQEDVREMYDSFMRDHNKKKKKTDDT